MNGVPTRKVKVGRFGWRMAGELLIFSIYQVGMDGRVFVARDVSSDRGGSEGTNGKPNEVGLWLAACISQRDATFRKLAAC